MDWPTLNVILGVVLTLATIVAFVFIARSKPGMRRHQARIVDDD